MLGQGGSRVEGRVRRAGRESGRGDIAGAGRVRRASRDGVGGVGVCGRGVGGEEG